MITDSTATIDVEFPHLLRGVHHMCLGSMMIDAITMASAEHQLTKESQALMQDLSSFKVWLTGTERSEKAMIEITRLATECMFQVPSVSAEPSGLQ